MSRGKKGIQKVRINMCDQMVGQIVKKKQFSLMIQEAMGKANSISNKRVQKAAYRQNQ